MRKELRRLIHEMRNGMRYKSQDLGYEDSVSSYRVDEWADAIEALMCDCIESGNPNKPKQHSADPHAKNCAYYREF